MLDAYLHYRMVDVSSIKELARRWYPRAYFASPPKHGGHRALADIRESIQELRYYREAVFVPPPGPDSVSARQIAARYAIGTGPDDQEPPAPGGGRIRFGPVTGVPLCFIQPGSERRAMVGVAQLVRAPGLWSWGPGVRVPSPTPKKQQVSALTCGYVGFVLARFCLILGAAVSDFGADLESDLAQRSRVLGWLIVGGVALSSGSRFHGAPARHARAGQMIWLSGAARPGAEGRHRRHVRVMPVSAGRPRMCWCAVGGTIAVRWRMRPFVPVADRDWVRRLRCGGDAAIVAAAAAGGDRDAGRWHGGRGRDGPGGPGRGRSGLSSVPLILVHPAVPGPWHWHRPACCGHGLRCARAGPREVGGQREIATSGLGSRGICLARWRFSPHGAGASYDTLDSGRGPGRLPATGRRRRSGGPPSAGSAALARAGRPGRGDGV